MTSIKEALSRSWQTLTAPLRPARRRKASADAAAHASPEVEDHLSTARPPSTPHLGAPQGPELPRPGSLVLRAARNQDYADDLATRHDPNIQVASWQDSHGGETSKRTYAVGYWTAALLAARTLRMQPSTSAQALLTQLASRRAVLAAQARAPRAREFGQRIPIGSPGILTPINEKYDKFPEAAALKEQMFGWWEAQMAGAPAVLPRNVHEHAEKALTWVVKARTHDGHSMDLLELSWRGPEGPRWIHADPSQAGHREIEALFQRATAPLPADMPRAERVEQVCKNTGRLHWWLSQQCHFARGSAGISDMLSAAILLHHGFEHPGWKANVSADVRALCMPDQEAFAAQYRDMMRSTPTDARA